MMVIIITTIISISSNYCIVRVFGTPDRLDSGRETMVTPRSIHDIKNPLIDLEQCGRKGLRSHVCDPDATLLVDEAYQLDDSIRNIFNDTKCPCDASICKQTRDEGGYLIGIVIIRAMKLDRRLQRKIRTQEDRIKYMDDVMNEARIFAYRLLNNWKMGRCNEDIIIFYSINDNTLYTVTHSTARQKMTDDVLAEITSNLRIHFSENLANGLKKMLNAFRSILLDEEWKSSFPESEHYEEGIGLRRSNANSVIKARTASHFMPLHLLLTSKLICSFLAK